MSQAASPHNDPLLPCAQGVRSAPDAPVGARVDSKATAPRLITSAQLFAGAPEVHIEHHGALYRLKHTSLGKLILTK